MSTRLNLFLIVFLILAFSLRLVQVAANKPSYRVGQRITITTVLNSQPQIFPKSQRFKVKGVKVIAPIFPEYSYGDKLKISGTLKDGVLIFPKIELLEKKKGNIFLSKIFAVRKRLISLFTSFLPEPEASLLLGIFLGEKKTLPKDFYLALKKTGVLHVVVASGMNLTMVIGFSLAVLSYILKRRWALLLTILAILFYVALSGFDPPIIRAAIMGTVLLGGSFFGRLEFRVLSLLLSGYLMLFFDPDLISNLSFQLSFLSTTGLIFIKPLFLIKKEDPIYLLKDDLVTTFSAQLATLPILLSNFGQYRPLSLLVNTLVLWTTPILMALGGIVAVAGLSFAPLGQLVAFLALPFLVYFKKIVIFFGQFSFGELRVGQWPIFLTFAYYFFLTSILIFCYKKEGEKCKSRGCDRS